MNDRSILTDHGLRVLLGPPVDELLREDEEQRQYVGAIFITGDHSIVVFSHEPTLPESVPIVMIEGSDFSSAGIDYVDVINEGSHEDLILHDRQSFGEEIALFQATGDILICGRPRLEKDDLLLGSFGCDLLYGGPDPIEIERNTYPAPQSLRGNPRHQHYPKPLRHRTGFRRTGRK